MRSGEHVISNQHGTFRAGSIMRKPEDGKWSAELIKSIRGSPKEPRPGSSSTHIPVFVKYDANSSREARQFAAREAPRVEARQMSIYLNLRTDMDRLQVARLVPHY